MKPLLTYIIEHILSDVQCEIDEEESDGFHNLTVHVPKDHMGKIIGKNGRIINSIKNLMKVKAVKDGVKLDIQIVEKI